MIIIKNNAAFQPSIQKIHYLFNNSTLRKDNIPHAVDNQIGLIPFTAYALRKIFHVCICGFS